MEMLNDSTKQKEIDAADSVDSGRWWVSWINTAKERTSTVFEAVRKDLDELAIAVRNEASSVGASIESSLSLEEDSASVGTMKKSISSFFDQVTKALIPPLEEDDAEAVLITHDGTVTLTGFTKHLADLQAQDKTYLELDSKLTDNYKRWMEVIEQDQFTQERLARHLIGSEILNDKYLSLVPEKICHMEFWQRYLFKRALLEDALANAKVLENRAKLEIDNDNSASLKKGVVQTEQPKLSIKNMEDENYPIEEEETNIENVEKDLLNDDLNWENEDIKCNIKLTEEEQIRLLEQYDQEIQERGGCKKKVSNERAKTNKIGNKEQPKYKTNDKKLNHKKNIKSIDKAITIPVIEKDIKKLNNATSQLMSVPQTVHHPTVPQTEKEKDEISSASDESWEKDFDLND